MHRRHGHYSDSANGPTYGPQLDAEQIQSLVDQRIKVLLGAAGSQHLDSCPQRPCLPAMLPTGYGGQPMSMTPPGPPPMPMQMNGLLRPPAMGPPPTVPGPTSNGLPNPGAKYQGNPTALASGAVDGCNVNDAASGLQSPTQSGAIATSCILTDERGSPCLSPHVRANKLAKLPPHVREATKLANESKVRFGSWNVGFLTGKLSEIVDTAASRCVNILCIQEIKWSVRDEEEVEDKGFKLGYKGRDSVVGILIDKSLKDRVIGVTRKGRIILVKLIVDNVVLNVISVSAPKLGASENAKWGFWKDLKALVRNVPRIEKLFIGGDFLGGQVGTSGQNFERVHGGFGCGDINQEGEEILNFAEANDLMVANTFFRKEKSRIVTFIDGQNSSQINFFLARRRDRLECKDCEVIPGGCVVSQHQLLVSDFVFGDETMAGGVTKKRKKKDRMMPGFSRKKKINYRDYYRNC